jgi:EmrB/QacA subfamily drug resistance transporter
VCGASTSAQMLVAARFVQGVGGAMATAVTLGMIVTMFPGPAERARAIGVFSFVAAAGASIGLLAGGVLTAALSWHWIFLVNLPIGIAAMVLATRLVPAERGIGLREGADVLGAVLVTAALMLGVYTIVKVDAYGWGSAHTLGLGAVAAALFVAFVLRQVRAARPLLPLRVFRSRTVTGANLVQILTVAGLFGMFFMGTLYMQRVLGYDALRVGLGFLPVAVLIGTLSVGFSARLSARFGERAVLMTGLVLILTGLVFFTRAPVDGHYATDLLPVMLPLGAGAGLSFPTLMALAMSGATEEDAGLASGLVNTTAQVGGALGLAVLATLSTSRTAALLAGGAAPDEALTGGFHLAFGIAAALVAAAIVLTATVLRPAAAGPVLRSVAGPTPRPAEQARPEPGEVPRAHRVPVTDPA